MRQLYEERYLADSKIMCNGRVWPVHRVVFAAQSKLFQEEFERTGTLELNVGSAIVDQLVEFVYLGRIVSSN